DPSLNAKYEYDSLYRLIEATLDPDRAKEETLQFSYDSIDNLTSKTSSRGKDSADHVGQYQYAGSSGPHRLVSAGSLSFEHDAAGRITRHQGQKLSWDFLGRLKASDEGVQLSYGPAH